MEIQKLLGHRVYVEFPEEPTTNIYLDEATKAAMAEDRLKKWERLTVYAVGSSITDLQEGDEIMLDPSLFATPQGLKVFKVSLSSTKEVMLISYFDIAHIW